MHLSNHAGTSVDEAVGVVWIEEVFQMVNGQGQRVPSRLADGARVTVPIRWFWKLAERHLDFDRTGNIGWKGNITPSSERQQRRGRHTLARKCNLRRAGGRCRRCARCS